MLAVWPAVAGNKRYAIIWDGFNVREVPHGAALSVQVARPAEVAGCFPEGAFGVNCARIRNA